MIEVIIPYVKAQQELLGDTHPAATIMDNFKGQVTASSGGSRGGSTVSTVELVWLAKRLCS